MTKSIFILAMSTFCLSLFSCGTSSKQEHRENHQHKDQHGHANKHMNETPFEELIARFESPERTKYQKPDEVLKHLGDLKDKKVFEIGAGSGYFSFRLVGAGAQVIAGDVDERFQNYIKEKKEKLGISDQQLSLRMLPYDAPNLADAEVDMVLIVNTYHHIENRAAYFAKVKKGLKENGQLVVIDFFKKELPFGPPLKMKVTEAQVQKELSEAGFTEFDINQKLLPYQYIVMAK